MISNNRKFNTFDAVINGETINSTVCPRMTLKQWTIWASKDYNVALSSIVILNASVTSSPFSS